MHETSGSTTGSRPRVTGRLVFGIIVVTLGVLFTLDNLDLVESGEVLQYWPVLLVFFGLQRLTGMGSERRPGFGFAMTIFGTWLLLHNLGIFPYDPWDFWPVLLILLGFSMVTGSLRRAKLGPAGVEDPSTTISALAFWSGIERKVVSQDFRGGDITAIMGGHEIDLRPAGMSAGSQAVIDMTIVMGGVDIRVPEDWKVSCEVFPIMGGVEDHSKPPAGEVRGHLVLKGFVMMGGVEIKN